MLNGCVGCAGFSGISDLAASSLLVALLQEWSGYVRIHFTLGVGLDMAAT